MVFRVDGDAMPGRVGQGARELVGIEVEYADRIAAGDIYSAVVAVRGDVINSPGGWNLRGGKNPVVPGRFVIGRSDVAEAYKSRQADGSRKNRPAVSGKFFHQIAPGCPWTVGYGSIGILVLTGSSKIRFIRYSATTARSGACPSAKAIV
jgi:hypothetical protein